MRARHARASMQAAAAEVVTLPCFLRPLGFPLADFLRDISSPQSLTRLEICLQTSGCGLTKNAKDWCVLYVRRGSCARVLAAHHETRAILLNVGRELQS